MDIRSKRSFRAILQHVQIETIQARVPLGHSRADECLCGGLLPGALHEIFANAAGAEAAASGFALALTARVLSKRQWVLWVQQDFSALEAGEIHANGLLELGIDPARALMLCVPDAKAALRAGAEGLGCKGVGAVIIELWNAAHTFDLAASRRLTLAARRNGIAVIVLHLGATPEPSAAETRWLIRSATSQSHGGDWGMPVFDAALLRNRQGRTGHWMMAWDCNNGTFQEAHSRAVVPRFTDRPAETPMEGIRQAG